MKIEPIQEECRKLKGKTAIITGASRGMGRAGALVFGQHGAEVVVNYNSNKEAADRVVARIEELGGRAIAVKADVVNMKDLPGLVDHLPIAGRERRWVET